MYPHMKGKFIQTKIELLRRKSMKKVFLGMVLLVAISISVNMSAQDAKMKKEASTTETTKNGTTCCSATTTAEVKACSGANVTAQAKTCCSSTTTAEAKTCCSTSTTAEAKTCCSTTTTADAKTGEKKDCGQVEKIIAEKKSEVKKKQ